MEQRGNTADQARNQAALEIARLFSLTPPDRANTPGGGSTLTYSNRTICERTKDFTLWTTASR